MEIRARETSCSAEWLFETSEISQAILDLSHLGKLTMHILR